MTEQIPTGAGPPVGVPRALARLLHHRWALPILAQVVEERGCKFITLSRRLGVRAERLRPALAQLAELDLVISNPGYGHPMRPEYILGAVGAEVAEPARALVQWLERADLKRTGLKKWQLPALSAVGHGATRFNEIQAELTGATPRAVTLALKDLIGVELITRRVDEGFPPTPRYAASRRARTALRHVDAVGRPLALGLAS